MNVVPTATMDELTDSHSRVGRTLDFIVAIRLFAVFGALLAAIAPAIMSKADGTTLRGSISAYWNVDPAYLFWLPFTIGGVLLIVDSIVSYVSPNHKDFGGRWYNLVLGMTLLVLTWRNIEEDPALHYPAAVVFFALFILVIAYTSSLGWFGVHIEPTQPENGDSGTNGHNRATEKITAQVSIIFLLLLVVTLLAWAFDLITLFFFEVFALLNFALYYVQGAIRPFPFAHYEFPWSWLNDFLRSIGIMRRPA